MGNIISDNKGNIRTYNNTETDENKPSAFTKNMTDILFELDLYNTGNYYEQNTTQNPRSEFDYTERGKEKSKNNIDITNSGRRSINGNYTDIIGLQYEDSSLNIDSLQKPLNDYNHILIDKDDRKINKFYNLKRGFCMGGNSVPIDIVGVDIPSNDRDAYWNKIGQNNIDLFRDQKNIYNYTDTMDTDVEKCLTWGTLTPPSDEFNKYTGTDYSTTIPDINIMTDNLNTLASSKNVYGNTLSPDCITLLDKTIMNSYVSPKINQYKSLNLSVSNNGLIETNGVLRPDTNKNIENLNPNEDFNIYNTTNSAGLGVSGSGIDGTDHNTNANNGGQCGVLEENLCEWHYYYDIVDGTLFNKDFTNSNKLDNNLRYLQERIPDCRCIALNRASKDVLLPDEVKKYLINEFNTNQCNKNNNYGQKEDRLTLEKSSENYKKSLLPEKEILLYNEKSNLSTNNYSGYRRQFDPTSVTSSGLTLSASGKASTDSSFLYAPEGVRLKNIVSNTYTCKIDTKITVTGVGGNSIINGVSSVCNFKEPPPPPPPAAQPGAQPGTQPATQPATQPTTSNSATKITIESISYNDKTIENNDDPLNIGDEIKVNARWTDFREPHDPESFTSNYEFVGIASDKSEIIFPYSNNLCPVDSNRQCISPFSIRIPFLYGSETNMIGIPCNIGLRSKSNGSNKISATNTKVIKLKQYSMRITYVQPIQKDNKNYIYVGIDLNTADKLIIKDIKIILTLTSQINDKTPIVIEKRISELTDGAIQFSDNNIKNEKYTYSINIDNYAMNYDVRVPISQKNAVDFSNLKTKFIDSMTKLEYVDTNDNNSIILVTNDDTIPYCASLIFTWELLSYVDNTDNNIDIYYDTNVVYDKTSATRVKIASNIALSSTGITSGILSNSYQFISPILDSSNSNIIVYGEIINGDNTIYTSPIKIQIETGKRNYKNWIILPITNNKYWTLQDMISTKNPITSTKNIDQTIDYYLNNNSEPYIVYDSNNTMNKEGINWFSGNGPPKLNSDTSIQYKTTYTIFVRPIIQNINIKSIKQNNNSIDLSKPISVLYGSKIAIEYSIDNKKPPMPVEDFPVLNSDIIIQVIIANKNDKSIKETIYTEKVTYQNSDPILPPQITFPLIYDTTIINPIIYITSYSIYNSATYDLNISLDTTLQLPLISNVIKKSIDSQLINILSDPNTTADDTLIKNIDITFNSMYNSYYVMLSNFSNTKSLTILSTNLNFKKIDFLQPLKIIFTLPPQYLTFKNVNKGRRQLESFYNNMIIEKFDDSLSLNINDLHIDLSTSTLNTITTLKFIFSGYNKIYINNLTLMFGKSNLDNKKFNIIFSPDSISKQTTVYEISNITFIGELKNKFSIINKIPGLDNINYSVSTLINNNYAYIVPLIYSNGYYGLPETYNTQLNNKLKATNLNKSVTPLLAVPPAESGLSAMTVILIILGIIAVIGGGAFIYFKYIKKNN